MSLFKFKSTEKIAELKGRIAELEHKMVELERAFESNKNIRVGELSHLWFWSDPRPKISIAEALSLLIKQQGLELMHTNEKTELVKTKNGRA